MLNYHRAFVSEAKKCKIFFGEHHYTAFAGVHFCRRYIFVAEKVLACLQPMYSQVTSPGAEVGMEPGFAGLQGGACRLCPWGQEFLRVGGFSALAWARRSRRWSRNDAPEQEGFP